MILLAETVLADEEQHMQVGWKYVVHMDPERAVEEDPQEAQTHNERGPVLVHSAEQVSILCWQKVQREGRASIEHSLVLLKEALESISMIEEAPLVGQVGCLFLQARKAGWGTSVAVRAA